MATAKKLLSPNSTEIEIINLLDSLELPSRNGEIYSEALTVLLVEYFIVDKASIWLFSSDETSMICLDLFDSRKNEHTSGQILRAPDFSIYFKSLNDADDLPSGLKTLLDIPLKASERIIGVLCLEQVDEKRPWTNQECNLLKIAALSVSKTLASMQRIKYLEDSLADEREKTNHPIKMAHEINNPLTIILGNAYLLNSLAEEKVQDVELQKSSIKKIVEAANRIDKIIRGVRFKK